MDQIDLNSGEFILDWLERAGSDKNKKHAFTFWLYFPSEELAKKASETAKKVGLKPRISPPFEKRKEWLCLLSCPHIPDEAILDGIGVFCADLAKTYKGNFDGWETELRK